MKGRLGVSDREKKKSTLTKEMHEALCDKDYARYQRAKLIAEFEAMDENIPSGSEVHKSPEYTIH
jgi:hypothetical protein